MTDRALKVYGDAVDSFESTGYTMSCTAMDTTNT